MWTEGESETALSERLFIIFLDYTKNECVDFYLYRLVLPLQATQLFKQLIEVIFA